MDNMNAAAKNRKFLKVILISAGTFFMGLGIAGIFIPVLPTTPFILVSAGFYAKSSSRFYNWLINNRIFGRYLKNYREGKGIPFKIKIITIIILWITIGLSAAFALEQIWARILLLLVAAGVSVHIAYIRPRAKTNTRS